MALAAAALMLQSGFERGAEVNLRDLNGSAMLAAAVRIPRTLQSRAQATSQTSA